MLYKQKQYLGIINSKKGKITLRVLSSDDAAGIRALSVSMVNDDYIFDYLNFKDVEECRKKYVLKKLRDKQDSIYLVGLAGSEIVLFAQCIKKKIYRGKFKGKYKGEVGIMIKKGYRHIGIGGKLIDFFIKKAKEMQVSYIWGQFFSENFDSLVLCKSRNLKIYRVDKNRLASKKWGEKYTKWGRKFDRVNAKLILEK